MITIKSHRQVNDWDGFNTLVSKSSINEKNTILSLTDRNKQKSQKEKGELLQDMKSSI